MKRVPVPAVTWRELAEIAALWRTRPERLWTVTGGHCRYRCSGQNRCPGNLCRACYTLTANYGE